MKRFLTLITFGLLVSCGSHDQPTHKDLPTIKIRVAEVSVETVPILEQVVGTVAARQQASVAAKVTGRIVTMNATAGKAVKKGDLLAEIEVNETRAALDRAQASLTNADRDLKRYQSLLASAAVTQEEYDRVETQKRMASASVHEIESLLEHALVRAPFDGVIIRRIHERGDLATPGEPLFVIKDTAAPRLEINVPESLISKLKMEANLPVDFAGMASTIAGVVSEITPSADPASRTFLVKLDLPKTATIKVGQFGRAGVPRGERRTLLIPALARLRIVRLGEASADRTEILAGVGEGERVILNPPSELRDGQPIDVQP